MVHSLYLPLSFFHFPYFTLSFLGSIKAVFDRLTMAKARFVLWHGENRTNEHFCKNVVVEAFPSSLELTVPADI